jgi:ribosome-associated toxin RatA of RatAB toxin-antitoxin module
MSGLSSKSQFIRLLRSQYSFANLSKVNQLSYCRTFFTLPSATSPTSSTQPKFKKHYERRLLPYTQDQCYDVVADVERYSEFVPWVKESIIMKKEENSNVIEADLVVGFNVVNITERYTSIVTLNKPVQVNAVSKQTNLFENLSTEWKFAPARDSKSCWVTFKIDFEFKSSIYNQISDLFMKDVVNNMVKAFENQCKKRYQGKK